MAKQVINVGTTAGDGSGDALRDAMIKINANFTELYEGIVVQTIVGENGTTLVDISTNSVNANALTGTVPTGVATWDNLGGKPTSVAGFGIADAYTIAQTDAQIASEIDDLKISLAADGGDLKGSVFADDSTLLVDGVNGTIPAANLSGALPALDGSALTGVVKTGDTTLVELDAGLNVGGADLHLQNHGILEQLEQVSNPSGTVSYDCNNTNIWWNIEPSADWTANFININVPLNSARTLTLIIQQGATAYIPTGVELFGDAQTIRWQGGSAPSGTADGIDVVVFSVIVIGATYHILGQLVDFS